MFSVVICSRSATAARRIDGFAVQRGVTDAVRPVSSAAQVLTELADRPAEVVVIDTAAAAPDAARFVRRVRATAPRTSVVLVGITTPHDNAAALAAGARGVIAAGPETGELVAAVVGGLLTARHRPGAEIPTQRPAVAGITVAVTDRELQVLRAMSLGHSNAEIGSLLFLTEDTVKTHARHLYRKLGVRDRAHAVAAGFRTGLVSLRAGPTSVVGRGGRELAGSAPTRPPTRVASRGGV